MKRQRSSQQRGALRYESLENRNLMTAGLLDSTFGSGGIVTTPVGNVASASAWGVAIQADGKIVAAGSANMGSSTKSNLDFALVRYDAAGALDASFGTDGKLTTAFGSGNDVANDVLLQPDGKIVVAGTAASSNGDFAIARYTSVGKLDGAFGNQGKATTDFKVGKVSGSYDNATAAALQGDGKLIVVGSTCIASSVCPRDNDIALARYKTDGSLDTTFGGSGKVITKHLDVLASSAYTQVNDIAQLADGRIVVAGTARVAGSSEANRLFAVVYSTSGNLDASFGSGGVVSVALNIIPSAVANVAIQPDGKILLATTADTGTNAGITLVRYDALGNLDGSFGSGGVAMSALPVTAKSVAIQGDGKVVVGGPMWDATGSNIMAVARFRSDGSVDGTFGTVGLGTTSTGFSGVAQDLAIYPNSGTSHDSQIVLAGGGSFTGSTQGIAVARFQADAALHAVAAASHPVSTQLLPSEVTPVLSEAWNRWRMTNPKTAVNSEINVHVADLGGTTLGLASGNTIWLDDNAAGWGWFVDTTAGDDSEFVLSGSQGEQDRIDLLTVVMHELGHLLGHEHEADGVMEETLAASVRRTEVEHQHIASVDQLLALWSDDHASGGRRAKRGRHLA